MQTKTSMYEKHVTTMKEVLSGPSAPGGWIQGRAAWLHPHLHRLAAPAAGDPAHRQHNQILLTLHAVRNQSLLLEPCTLIAICSPNLLLRITLEFCSTPEHDAVTPMHVALTMVVP